MRALVTGAAGFIGSSIVDRLLRDGAEVVGVDSFTPYYTRDKKERNLELASQSPRFKLIEADLSVAKLDGLFEGVTHVFHQAGQPGVRNSWGDEFFDYVNWNIIATQRLLEFARSQYSLKAFVAASSSSVYGSALISPTTEEVNPEPISPYGVTKLAAEKLCTLYASQYGVPTVSLRYFTVYGPRQRPDMAFQKIIDACLHNKEFVLNGTGEQVRDFTFIDDVVAANISAARHVAELNRSLPVMNIGGGKAVSLRQVIEFVQNSLGRKLKIVEMPHSLGDPMKTSADCTMAIHTLGWGSKTDFFDGVMRQIEWNIDRGGHE